MENSEDPYGVVIAVSQCGRVVGTAARIVKVPNILRNYIIENVCTYVPLAPDQPLTVQAWASYDVTQRYIEGFGSVSQKFEIDTANPLVQFTADIAGTSTEILLDQAHVRLYYVVCLIKTEETPNEQTDPT